MIELDSKKKEKPAPQGKQSPKREPSLSSPQRKQSQDIQLQKIDNRKTSVGKLPALTDRKLDKGN